MFNKSPSLLFAAIFNIFQGLTMTLSISWYQGMMNYISLCRTFVCAYCAGFMLTVVLRVPDWCDRIVKLLHCEKPYALNYIVGNLIGGAIVGVFMNFFISFMMIGPESYYPAAFFHTLWIAIPISAVSSTLWVGMVQFHVIRRVYPAPAGETPAGQD